MWNSFEVPGAVAEAVVFPEIERYSRIRDKVETMSVKAFYVKGGKKGGAVFNPSDFSLGMFQMKPSFVEALERRWMRSEFPARYDAYFDLSDTEGARRARMARIEDIFWQSVYLAMFIKLLWLDYDLGDLDPKEQVALAAVAYNHGVVWCSPGAGDTDKLRAMAEKSNYSAAALSHWKKVVYLYE